MSRPRGERPGFFLDPQASFELSSPPGTPEVLRWQAPAHALCVRPALILLAGECLILAAPPEGAWAHLTFCAGLPEISADGLELELARESASGREPLLRVALPRGRERFLHEIALALPPGEGRLVLSCLPGPQGDPCADWLALRECAIGPREDLPRLRARAFRTLRAENERAHFAAAYAHPMYVERFTRARSIDSLIPSARSLTTPDGCRNAFDLAHAWLGERGGEDVPDFTTRLREIAARLGRPPRIASLCAGTAATEAALLRGAGITAELTLVDVDPSLLDAAGRRDWGATRVTPLLADVNALKLPAASFDIVLCVSGAHHLVELESVFAELARALDRDGELWLIGEQIGPNGNRLDDEALAAANEVFAALPERLRRNQRSGQADAHLPNDDCAEATFEGIRSADIEPVLAAHFSPVELCRRNAFLWRIVGPDYVLNYDIASSEDRDQLSAIVDAEIEARSRGARPTELHGIYRPL